MEDMTGTKKISKATEAKTTVPSITQRHLDTYLRTDEQCMGFLVEQRWPEGVWCPRCGSQKVHKLAKPWKWQCKQCAKNGYRFSPLVGTIFENTNVGLSVWFKVIFAMCHSKKGISALQIYRMVGGKYPHKKGAYRTAWYMCMRIRAAMKDPDFRKLMGIVEVDETFVGGKDVNRHRDKKYGHRDFGGKVPVIGAIARKGNVVAKVIENLDTNTLSGFVRDAISDKVDLVATDQAPGYDPIGYAGWAGPLSPGLHHETVNHSEGEYVRGIVHTANIDSFWSLFKRGVMGSFHHVSKKYLPLYLNEFSFRSNNRKDPDIFQKVIALA